MYAPTKVTSKVLLLVLAKYSSYFKFKYKKFCTSRRSFNNKRKIDS